MEQTKIIKINKVEYHFTDDVKEIASTYSKGMRTFRELVKKKNISDDKYLFDRIEEMKWKKTAGANKKYDNLLVTVSQTFTEYKQ